MLAGIVLTGLPGPANAAPNDEVFTVGNYPVDAGAANAVAAKQKAMATLVYEQSQRLSDIITELMDFAKPVPPQIKECDLADLIDRALHEAKMQADVVDRRVELTIGDVPAVVVDPDQVMAALMELFDNAFHATDPVRGLAKDAAFDLEGFKTVLRLRADFEGSTPEPPEKYFDLSFHQLALAGL